MFKNKIVFLLSFLFLLLSTKTLSERFIYQGERVQDDIQFSFVVAIYDNHFSDSLCTGTLIDYKWVLTAGHCVEEDEKPSDYFVGFGHAAGRKETAQKIVAVKKFFIYKSPKDKGHFRIVHDIALLELTEPVAIKPVELPMNPDVLPDLKSGKQVATSVGYGWTSITWPSICDTDPHSIYCAGNTARDEYLYAGSALIQSDGMTEALLKKYKILEDIPDSEDYPFFPIYRPKTMIGITSPSGQRATNGDSGGPLLIKTATNRGATYIQVGVTSWGFTPSYTAVKNGYFSAEPVIYASVLNRDVLDFIAKIMHKDRDPYRHN